MNNVYVCPNCNATFNRDSQYEASVEMINATSFDTKEVIDFCGVCNTFEYEEE